MTREITLPVALSMEIVQQLSACIFFAAWTVRLLCTTKVIQRLKRSQIKLSHQKSATSRKVWSPLGVQLSTTTFEGSCTTPLYGTLALMNSASFRKRVQQQ